MSSPEITVTVAESPPAPRGVSTQEPDLWCTYAALRTLSWTGRLEAVPDPQGTVDYLHARRNSDGGYAWSRGMAADAWATYYCTQALRDLHDGHPVATADWAAAELDRTGEWLHTTWSGQAYAMMPGQAPDVWATYFSVRTATEVCGRVPDPEQLVAWLGGLQTAEGGLSWSPEHAAGGWGSDARACYYGVIAWSRLQSLAGGDAPWDLDALVGWLRGQQGPDGGFRFAGSDPVSCLWATFRATNALAALDSGPADPDGCRDWVLSRQGGGGAFTRWPGYPVEDVWACFSAVGALRALGEPVAAVVEPVATTVVSFACSDGGFTYREPVQAADALSTSAALLGLERSGDRDDADRSWLEDCLLPNEDGVMYMPGRGSEIRCTLWALAAGAFADHPELLARIATWVGQLQNPDGGFGYWKGRASDVVSTSSALEILHLTATDAAVVDHSRLAGFLDSCRNLGAVAAYANVPGGTPTLRSTAQSLRARQAMGGHEPGQARLVLEDHLVPGGGFANEGRRFPDLLSTFEATLTADRHGLDVDHDHLRRFLDRVATPAGSAWTPLSGADGGPLAACLAQLLRRRIASPFPDPLPALALS